MKKIDFVFFDAGGGHRSAATAVLHLVQHQQRPWQVRLVNLQELLAPIDLLRKLTGPNPGVCASCGYNPS